MNCFRLVKQSTTKVMHKQTTVVFFKKLNEFLLLKVFIFQIFIPKRAEVKKNRQQKISLLFLSFLNLIQQHVNSSFLFQQRNLNENFSVLLTLEFFFLTIAFLYVMRGMDHNNQITRIC